MSDPAPIDRDALFRLFTGASEGSITAADATELERLLASSPGARNLWFLCQDMDLGLDEWAAARRTQAELVPGAALHHPSKKPPVSLPRNSPLPRLAAAAAITAALGLALWTISNKFIHQPLATLNRAVSIQWAGPSFQTGSRILSPQSLDLTSGIVELSMSSGALVVFEGPGRMEVLSENSVHLHTGRLHANVPPAARGFTVTGTGFSAIDHGTRFGCVASDAHPAEIHVFEGEVELKPTRQSNRWMQASQALAIHPQTLETISARPELFLSPADLDALAANPAALRSQASRMLANHPAAVLYLNAADTTGNTLPNTARASSPTPPATLHHCTLTDGRDPTRNALAFDGESSHISLRLDHQSNALTLLAWVRCRASRHRQDLVSASGPLTSGDIAWYRHQSGSVGFGAHTPVPDMPARGWRMLHSAPLPATLTDWSLVATVVDAKAGSITHFFNGKVVGIGRISLPQTLHLGQLNIGATGLAPDSQTLVHHFHGALDELAIIAAPLTPEEISRLYQFGRPYL